MQIKAWDPRQCTYMRILKKKPLLGGANTQALGKQLLSPESIHLDYILI